MPLFMSSPPTPGAVGQPAGLPCRACRARATATRASTATRTPGPTACADITAPRPASPTWSTSGMGTTWLKSGQFSVAAPPLTCRPALARWMPASGGETPTSCGPWGDLVVLMKPRPLRPFVAMAFPPLAITQSHRSPMPGLRQPITASQLPGGAYDIGRFRPWPQCARPDPADRLRRSRHRRADELYRRQGLGTVNGSTGPACSLVLMLCGVGGMLCRGRPR